MRKLAMVAAALVLGACAPVQLMYPGTERVPEQVAEIVAKDSYVFSVNDQRTRQADDWKLRLQVLPGTQRLIVHLRGSLAERYGYVGLRTVFCAVAGRQYVVYPQLDVIARVWEPAVKDDATGRVAPPKPCAGDAAEAEPGVEAPAAPVPPPPPLILPPSTPPSAPPAPVPAPAPEPATPPPAESPAAPAEPPAEAAAPTEPAAAEPAAPGEPGVLARGGSAKLLGPARTRSAADAPAVEGLGVGVTVTLKVVLKKDTGNWWYVSGPAKSGWVLESELEAAP